MPAKRAVKREGATKKAKEKNGRQSRLTNRGQETRKPQKRRARKLKRCGGRERRAKGARGGRRGVKRRGKGAESGKERSAWIGQRQHRGGTKDGTAAGERGERDQGAPKKTERSDQAVDERKKPSQAR